MYDRCGLNLRAFGPSAFGPSGLRAAPLDQGLERWKRQLSVLRDGHALLTTLNEGVEICGSIGSIGWLLETKNEFNDGKSEMAVSFNKVAKDEEI